MKRLFTFFLITATSVFTPWVSANAEETVREFHGTGSTITSEFDIEAPWILDWIVNGEFENMLAIDIVLLDGKTGRQEGLILHTKRRGNGVKLFNTSGRYKLRIDSTLAKWDLKVTKITEEEAEGYTPRKKN